MTKQQMALKIRMKLLKKAILIKELAIRIKTNKIPLKITIFKNLNRTKKFKKK